MNLKQSMNIDNLSGCEKVCVSCLCDEIYDGISVLLFTLMAIKKDHLLKIGEREDLSQVVLKKIDHSCGQIVSEVNKLCGSNQLFCNHNIYSIDSDFYAYQ